MAIHKETTYSTTATRWDVWRDNFRDAGKGYPQLSGSDLLGVITDDGLGSFTVDCSGGCGHMAKTYMSRAGARAALIRHAGRCH